MPPTDDQALTGTIFDQSAILTIKDLSRMCNVEERHIVEFVEEGVLNVVEVRSEWHFTGDALRRARQHVQCAADIWIETRAFELFAEDLRLAQLALSEITGEFTSEDLLGEIFGSFCIGK